MLGCPPPPPRQGRLGTPVLNPPSCHGGQGGGGVGKMGLRDPPPPRRAIFFPPSAGALDEWSFDAMSMSQHNR